MEVDEVSAVPACDVVDLRTTAAREPWPLRIGRYLAALVAALVDLPFSERMPADLVVVRRDDGRELVRIRCTYGDGATMTLIRRQLESCTVPEFCRTWGVPADPPASARPAPVRRVDRSW